MTNKNKLVQVPEGVHEIWKKHYSFGDVKAIAEQNNVSAPVISRALNHKLASEPVSKIITDFYLKRAQ